MAKLKFKRMEGGTPTYYYVPMSPNENDTYVLQSGTVENANKLDNLDSTQLVRSDQDDTMTGVLTIQKDTQYPLLLDGGGSNAGPIGIQFNRCSADQKGFFYADHLDSNSQGADYSFHVGSNQPETNFILEGGGNFIVGTNQVYHQGNDGAGSGLDACKFHGVEESSFGRLDVARTWTAKQTFNKGIDIDTTTTGFLNFNISTTGGWARALEFKHRDNADTKGGLGYYGNGSSHNYMYMGYGEYNSEDNIRIAPSGALTLGTKNIFHEGHMGVGTGLDAEKLGGVDHGEYIKGRLGTGTLSARFDVGNINKSGFYYAGSGASDLPTANGSLLHIQYDSDPNSLVYTSQILVGTDSKMYYRYQKNGTWRTIYDTHNKPSKSDVGLGNLPNSKSDDWTTNSSSILATTAAVYQVRDDILNGASDQYNTLIELQQAIEGNDTDITGILNTLTQKVEKGGDTMTGTLNIDYGVGGLNLKPGADDRAYMGFYARTADKANRSGWLGFGQAASTTLSMYNEITSTYLELNGSAVNTNRYFTEGGTRVYSPSNKPTPDALGALPKTGGSMSGSVNFTSDGAGFYFNKDTDAEGYVRRGMGNNATEIGSDHMIYFKETDMDTTKISFDVNDGIYNFVGTLKEGNSRVWTAATFDPATKLSLTGGTMSGHIDMANYSIHNVGYLNGQAGNIAKSTDSWLRLNDGQGHSQGIYCGTSVVRTDGEIQVGSSGQKAKIDSNGVISTAEHIEIKDASIKYDATTKSISFVF